MLFVCLCKKGTINNLIINLLYSKMFVYNLILRQKEEKSPDHKFSSSSVPRAKARYSNGVNPVCFLNKEKKCSVDL